MSEKKRWILRDPESGVTEELDACSLDRARKHAEEWARQGDYHSHLDEDKKPGTIWVDVQIVDPNTDEVEDRHTVTIHPPVPACDDPRGHKWSSLWTLVGGIKENPGVWGHGGGAIIKEACIRCGCQRVTNTWAQRHDTGEQGLTSIEYNQGVYEV